MPSIRNCIVWAEPSQAGWLRAAMERADLAIVGAGSPEPGRAPELIDGLTGDRDTVQTLDDLRAALTTANADVIVIASPGDFGGGQRQGAMDREDAGALSACRARGVRVVTMEPMPCSALQLSIAADAGVGSAESRAEVVGSRMYLYMDYSVVNNSGQDLLFAPAFELANGEGEILRSGRDVPQVVTETIVKSLQNAFAEDQIEIIGTLLQGREHGKDGVVIWPVTDSNPERITVYAAGFSGETATVEPPNTDQRYVLRKTLRMDFDPPGDLVGTRFEAIPVREQSWIMR